MSRAATPPAPRGAEHAADSPFVVTGGAQMRALISPARQEIVDALVAAGPCSIAELGAHVGRAPDSLYFHVRRLVKVGLVIEREARGDGKRRAAVYDAPGRPMRLSYERAGHDRVLGAVVASALRLASRDFSRAFRLGVAVVEGERRNLWAGRIKGWLSDADLEEMNRLVTRLVEIIRTGRPGPGRRPQTLSFVLAPVRPNRRAPRAKQAPAPEERSPQGESP